MTRLPLIARRAEELIGSSVIATAPVAGGDISTATRVRTSDGTTALVKTHHQAPEGFFDAEARGLTWLAEATAAGGVAVPDLLGHDHECLVVGEVARDLPNHTLVKPARSLPWPSVERPDRPDCSCPPGADASCPPRGPRRCRRRRRSWPGCPICPTRPWSARWAGCSWRRACSTSG